MTDLVPFIRENQPGTITVGCEGDGWRGTCAHVYFDKTWLYIEGGDETVLLHIQALPNLIAALQDIQSRTSNGCASSPS